MLFNWSLLAMYVHVVVAPMEYYLSLDWHGAQLVDHEQFLYYWLYTLTGIFFVSSGAEIRPLSQWDLGDFFPNLKKKNSQSQKKKKKNFFFFFFFQIFHSVTTHTHTHKLHDDNLLELHPIFLQFNGNSMCNS